MRQCKAWFVAIFLSVIAHAAFASVATTKHNLSISGTGPIRASTEPQVCIFCHTPHNADASAPLWNREAPAQSYIPYNSTTAKAVIGQPTGASILCLSCHDGTVALGKVLSRNADIIMANGETVMPEGDTRLGTDLSDDHPISFQYTVALVAQRNGELAQPASLTGAVKLDANGQMQCTSCHDAHNNTNGKFLVVSNQGGALCETCHLKTGWSQTPHNLSSKTWNEVGVDPWPNSSWTTVGDNACQNCHQHSNAGGTERILNYTTEEANCTACHNGHVASKDVANEFNKTSFHPIDSRSGVHDANEAAIVNSRHVECYDCHDPHAAKAGGGNLAGPLTNVQGVSRTGAGIKPITSEYQLCFRCHADSTGKPAPPTSRVFPETNLRLEFDTSKRSYHPVVGVGRNPNVPSLINGLNTSSMIKCTDCHNNNDGPNTGGSGPNGPHGSNFPHLLERQNLTQDGTSEGPSAYALCYKCHDRNSILGNQSFSRHNFHITGQGSRPRFGLSTPCNVCHDPHGSDFDRLINFDTSVVSPNNAGRREFISAGTFSGECYLSCHGRNHNPCTYSSGGGNCGGGGGSP